MIPPFPYPAVITPPFPVPVLVKERLQHLRAPGVPTIPFNDVDVVFEGANLVTTKKTHALYNAPGLSSIFMDHTEMYSHAHSTFKDLFGIDANVNLVSYLSKDKAYSCFLITHNDFIVDSAGGKSLKLLLHLRSTLLTSVEIILDRIRKEKELRGKFPDCSIIEDNTDDVDPYRLEITLPPGVYPVIASQNPRGHEETPKFCLLLASHYDTNFSLMGHNKKADAKENFKNKLYSSEDPTIHVDPSIKESQDQFPIYGFTSLNVKPSFIQTYKPSTIEFNTHLNKELYNKFFDAMTELSILTNMADTIPLTQLDFQAILADFYQKRTLVTSLQTDKNLETNLKNLYATAKKYIKPMTNPRMSAYVDFFIKSNLIKINSLYSNNPENIFNNSILKDKDSYTRFKSEDKIPSFIYGTQQTPLYSEYRKEQAESLEKLIAAGYNF